jgi:hypothetical protein
VQDLTESHLRSALPASKPTHSASLPTPGSASISSAPSFSAGGTGAPKPAFGAPAPAFGGAFGRPRPVVKKEASLSSISSPPTATAPSQIPLPASEGPSTPISPTPAGEEDGDSKERIKSAFDAFGPRVGGGGGGGFARPRPAGRR